MKKIIYGLFLLSCLTFTGCMDKYLDVFPEDKISSANFPENEEEVKMMLNGIYSQLKALGVAPSVIPNPNNPWRYRSLSRNWE